MSTYSGKTIAGHQIFGKNGGVKDKNCLNFR